MITIVKLSVFALSFCVISACIYMFIRLAYECLVNSLENYVDNCVVNANNLKYATMITLLVCLSGVVSAQSLSMENTKKTESVTVDISSGKVEITLTSQNDDALASFILSQIKSKYIAKGTNKTFQLGNEKVEIKRDAGTGKEYSLLVNNQNKAKGTLTEVKKILKAYLIIHLNNQV